MANNWLDKYEDGGYLGTTNVGRNYSPAWGGQFDMGGDIPGSVGFTYARTGDIPDNGKYAKKTLASAQNGMQFYQEGLDFQPKTISQKGSKIPPENRARGDMQSSYPQIARMYDGPQRKALAEAIAKREDEQRARRIIESQPSVSQYTPNKELEAANRYKFAKQYAATHGGYADDEGNIEETFVDRIMDSKTAAKAWDNIVVPGFEAEMLVSGAGLVGQGLKAAGKYAVENTALKNAYKLNPLALKENPEMFLYRTQPKDFVAGYTEQQYLKDLITDKILKGEKVPFSLQVKLYKIKYKPEPFRKALDEYHGQWFDKNPSRMNFYMKGRLDGDEGNMLRLKVPKEEGMAYNLKNFPEAQKASLNYDTEFIVPKDKLNQAEVFSTNDWQQLIQEDKAFNTPHWLRGYKEVPKPTSVNSSIETPFGFENRVFDKNVQLGEYKGIGHLSEPNYNYRVLSTKEIDAIRESKGVFPRAGKQKGGNQNVKYWTKGNEKNWYGDNPNMETIRVKQSNFNPNEIVNSKHVEVYDKQTGKFKPLKQGGIIKDDRGQWAKNKKNLLSLQSNWLSKFE